MKQVPLDYLDNYKSRFDAITAPHIHAFDKAHLVALTEGGAIKRKIGQQLLAGLRQMEAEGVLNVHSKMNSGLHAGERYLTKLYGSEIGGQIATGRSSGDLNAVSRRRAFAAQICSALDGMMKLRHSLIELASKHIETVMAGNTHGQHAQPTTLAHWALMFELVAARHQQRYQEAHARINQSPAGAAIMTGSDFPIDRRRSSELLGFDGPLPNTFDAIISHDMEIEYAGLMAGLTHSLARLADDLQLWSTFEYGYVELPDYLCGTSSIMPQKKNPDGLEDIKSLATQASSAFLAVSMSERGPTGFTTMERVNTDSQLKAIGEMIPARLDTLSRLVGDVRFDVARMSYLAGANWCTATDLAAAIARETALGWRKAHELVAGFVAHCFNCGMMPNTVTSADLDAAANQLGFPAPSLDPQLFRESLSPLAFVGRRSTYGSPAPANVCAQIKLARESQTRDAEQQEKLRCVRERAAKALDEAVNAILE